MIGATPSTLSGGDWPTGGSALSHGSSRIGQWRFRPKRRDSRTTIQAPTIQAPTIQAPTIQELSDLGTNDSRTTPDRLGLS